ncbi:MULTISPECIES: iron ABC transporter permease [unclassified Nocardioides]|uniref:iron ABC transporter permease n=1 Tax=unclassified Nocardioides TaxID=2615069 RepID=UPI0006FA5BF0|nr:MULTISPECIES: iron ABC transporter permease [unclassified Nocardioides]KQY57163.1 ABC transporter permease [Nocardioides sp. Root140]KQZ68676.1 ABC transporter permease [Nocardioides sp. Root151]KRF11806.1 ABC transporter permease [Nocardioides sp. Soil796]
MTLRSLTGLGVLVLVALAASAVHLTQGTSAIGFGDLLELALGRGDELTRDVFMGSRLPRLLAGLVVGLSVGVSGALLQSVTRNPLASPDTLAINGGAWFAATLVAALGISLPLFLQGSVAFLGGLLGAGIVLALSGGASGPARLVLAGSALALALGSLTGLLLLLFEEQTQSLFAWGNGNLVQISIDAPAQGAVAVVVVVLVAMLLSRQLDLISLGDDAASSLGVNVRLVQLAAVLIAVLLASLAVTVAGPMGFIGLCAPVLARLSGPWIKDVHKHSVLLPLSGLIGIVLVVLADVLMRLVPTGTFGPGVPTGVATTMFGAIVLVGIARTFRQGGTVPDAPSARTRPGSPFRFTTLLVVGLSVLLVGATVLGLLAGNGWLLMGDDRLLLGDVTHWLTGNAGPVVHYTLEERTPRLIAATFAGAALALAGCATQAVCRNPLAEPGLLGVTAGAGVGAVTCISFVGTTALWTINAAALVGAAVAFVIVYAVSWRGGLDSIRLVLVGVGVAAVGQALIAFIIISASPYDTQLALTWLNGSTYGRTYDQVVPLVLVVLVGLPLLLRHRNDLDVMALDDDTPRVLGLSLERTRLLLLVVAVVLTAASAAAIGLVVFTGLVAPHAARAVVGSRHIRVLPVAMLLGALLVSLADTLGRNVIAPDQVPAGMVTALIGTPYFVWLLWRSRA